MKNHFLFLCLYFGAFLFQLTAQTTAPALEFEKIAEGFDRPVTITHAYDSRLFVVEKPGVIRVMYANHQVAINPFLDIRSKVRATSSEMGLLGLAFHPDFQSNGFFFVNYTNRNDETIISRFRLDLNNVNQADPNSEEVLLTIPQPFDNHNGGDLKFGADGQLYIPLGDGGSGGDPGDRSQNTQNLLGKILRINVDGLVGYTVPADNPFVNDPDVLNEIWSIGWRNPWRFSFDRLTGEMWVADVGQGRFEEVCIEAPNNGGLNYGWRCYEGPNAFLTSNCSAPSSYVDPIFSYDHLSLLGSSITGGFVYRGDDYPNLQGHYLVGDYRSGNVWTLKDDGTGSYSSTFWGKRFNRNELSTFGEDSRGELYAASYLSGEIFQVVDTSGTTSISALSSQNELLVFPNPANQQINLKLSQELFKDAKVSMLDMKGRLVEVPITYFPQKITVDLSQCVKGLYILTVDMDDQLWTQKISVK